VLIEHQHLAAAAAGIQSDGHTLHFIAITAL
jgi:hypothetical protein